MNHIFHYEMTNSSPVRPCSCGRASWHSWVHSHRRAEYRRPCNTSYPKSPDDDGDDDGDNDDDDDAMMMTTFVRNLFKKIDHIAAMILVPKLSKSEPSSRFFSRLKILTPLGS